MVRHLEWLKYCKSMIGGLLLTNLYNLGACTRIRAYMYKVNLSYTARRAARNWP